jgi:hypothetical protein
MICSSLRRPLKNALRVDRVGLDIAAGVRASICVAVPVAVAVATSHTVEGLVAMR